MTRFEIKTKKKIPPIAHLSPSTTTQSKSLLLSLCNCLLVTCMFSTCPLQSVASMIYSKFESGLRLPLLNIL